MEHCLKIVKARQLCCSQIQVRTASKLSEKSLIDFILFLNFNSNTMLPARCNTVSCDRSGQSKSSRES